LRPLIGSDKNEAVYIARRIGTFDMSSEQVPDSCTVFAPSNPATAVPLRKIIDEEALIPEYKSILQEVIENIEMITP
jgi:thiamine biosynthesis protein ThiI